jgi:hypothetical protein
MRLFEEICINLIIFDDVKWYLLRGYDLSSFASISSQLSETQENYFIVFELFFQIDFLQKICEKSPEAPRKFEDSIATYFCIWKVYLY